MIRLAALMVALATPAVAQIAPDAIVTLAGEHPGFTRLSLRIGTRDWQIGRTEEGYGLRMPDAVEVPTSHVFGTIGHQRLADLRAADGQVNLRVECECHLRVFRHARDWLVIDIRDGLAAPDNPFEQPLDPSHDPLPVVFPAAEGPFTRMLDMPPPPESATAEFRDALIADIGMAATTGEVTLQADLPVTEHALQPLAQLPVAAVEQRPINLHHDDYADGGVLHAALPVTICAADQDFALQDWAGESYVAATARAHERLALNPQDEGARIALARALVAYGFGQEARQILEDGGITQDRAPYLADLARMVDGHPALSDFNTQEGCTGAVSLWFGLAQGDLRHMDGAAISALLETFRMLPPDVRGQLAARLATLFQTAGNPGAAQVVLSIEGEPSGEAIATERSSADHVLGSLAEKLAAGAAVTAEDLQLLQSLRYEWRGTPEEIALQETEAHVLAVLGLYRQALGVAATLPPEVRETAQNRVIAALAANAPAEGVLEIALSTDPALPEVAIHLLADRLIDDGFAEIALRLLAPAASPMAMGERRYLRAAAAGKLGRVEMVEAELLGLTDERAMALRAAALSTTPEADAYAWRRDDLPALEASADPLLQQAAQTAQGERPALPPTPLASRQALIEQAQEARALANALLNRFGGPQ